jgi:CHAD domain-containing protein
MAFRLRPQEPVRRGLIRAATGQLRLARDELRKTTPPADEAVHEARKSIKKVRAVLHLIDADDGRGLTGCRKRLRQVNRTLSTLRDADAMLEMLAKLRKKDSRVFDEHTFARVHRRLSSHKEAAMQAAGQDRTWKRVDRALRTLHRKAKRWRPAHKGLGALAAGIKLTYRRGREALALARQRQGAADFHEWRKRIKALWYQLRLLEGCSRDLDRDARVLHQAETWLGDEHNVAVLCAELSKDASLGDLGRLRQLADRHQRELRRETIAIAGRIYRRKPGEFVRRIKGAWKTWDRANDTRRRRRAAA